MSYVIEGGSVAYDNIASGSVTGRENVSVGFLPPVFTADHSLAPDAISVTSITRSSQTATVTCTAHGLVTGNIAAIRGAVQPDYNGDFVITKTNANVYTYQVQGAPTTPATGTITSRFAGPYDNNAIGTVNPEPERLG